MSKEKLDVPKVGKVGESLVLGEHIRAPSRGRRGARSGKEIFHLPPKGEAEADRHASHTSSPFFSPSTSPPASIGRPSSLLSARLDAWRDLRLVKPRPRGGRARHRAIICAKCETPIEAVPSEKQQPLDRCTAGDSPRGSIDESAPIDVNREPSRPAPRPAETTLPMPATRPILRPSGEPCLSRGRGRPKENEASLADQPGSGIISETKRRSAPLEPAKSSPIEYSGRRATKHAARENNRPGTALAGRFLD
ncbi:hypothetical protein KM043_002929 [Ampulex compressa]|nr:hypothetical protein KM043_002929 [Ampulex compressa]